MKKIFLKAMLVFVVALTCVVISACGDDNDDETSSGGTINPTANVPDPEGTIEVSMRKKGQGDTRIDKIYINESDNFKVESDYWSGSGYIASYGMVNGLGNVSNIPIAGWASEVTVKPGYGYVAYHAGTFYRMYVSDYIVATTGGVIGAEVKYQKPFLGKDEAISLDEDALTFKAEGGEQSLVTNNSNIILFNCTTDVDWLHVEKSSTHDYAFLTNAITISCDASSSTSSSSGIVTLTTAYNKKKTIKVTRLGNAPYLELSETQKSVPSNEQDVRVGITTNYNMDDLSISGVPSWLTAEIADGTSAMRKNAEKIKFVGNERRTVAYDAQGAQSFSLQLHIKANYQSAERSATLTVKSKDGKLSRQLKLTQSGASIELSPSEFTVNASEGTSSVQVNCPFTIDKLKVKSSASWCTVSLRQSGSQILLDVKRTVNNTYKARNATVSISVEGSEFTASLAVTQSGISFNNIPSDVWFDRKSEDYTITLNVSSNSSDWPLPTSNQAWCTVSKNGYQLIIHREATTEDRVATLTFSGSTYKIKVHQSKYAVGDDYAEGKVTGTVCYMDVEGTRVIYRYLGEYQWSTELVSTGATDKNDGTKNMDVIKKIPNWQTLYPAFAAVDALNTDGVKGWYMPAKDEDNYFKGYYYWTSTEYNSGLSYKNVGYNNKSEKKKVIAIHKF